MGPPATEAMKIKLEYCLKPSQAVQKVPVESHHNGGVRYNFDKKPFVLEAADEGI